MHKCLSCGAGIVMTAPYIGIPTPAGKMDFYCVTCHESNGGNIKRAVHRTSTDGQYEENPRKYKRRSVVRRRARVVKNPSDDIIQAGPIRKHEGEYPNRIVLRKWIKDQFVTHVQVMAPGETPYYAWGHYFSNLGDAVRDYEKRVVEHQRDINIRSSSGGESTGGSAKRFVGAESSENPRKLQIVRPPPSMRRVERRMDDSIAKRRRRYLTQEELRLRRELPVEQNSRRRQRRV